MTDQYKNILDLLPYKSSFRFVDEISFVDDDKVIGSYTLRGDSFFYKDHFPGYPVTPGVIMIEIMAQIGLVVQGIYQILNTSSENFNQEGVFPLLTSTQVEFYKMVLPGETVEVHSKKNYFRFNKLKCGVEMFNAQQELVAKGIFSGIIKPKQKDWILNLKK